jgi:2EXR family
MAHFSDLPAELRLQIYRLLLESQLCEPSIYFIAPNTDFWALTRQNGTYSITPAGLTVCRQFQKELAHLFYGEILFLGESAKATLAFLRRIGPRNLASLAHLRVRIPNIADISSAIDMLQVLHSASLPLKVLHIDLPAYDFLEESQRFNEELYMALKLFENTDVLKVCGTKAEQAVEHKIDKRHVGWIRDDR